MTENIFDALNQAQNFINEMTDDWSPQKKTVFNMYLLAQIVSSETHRLKA